MKGLKDRTRILFTYANTTELGGADFCLLKLAAALNPDHFEVHVAFSQKCDLEGKYLEENIKVEYINMPRLRVTKNPFRLFGYFVKSLFSTYQLVKYIKEHEIDIVHANDLLDYCGPLAAKLAGIRSVQHVRMIIPAGKLQTLLGKLALLLNDKVVAVSKGTANAMFKKGNSSQKVIIGYDWYDPKITGHQNYSVPFRQEMNIPENILLIGIVGRLQYWKGQHIFLQAGKKAGFETPKCETYCLWGEVQGRHRNYAYELHEIAEKLQLNETVLFTGYRPDVMNVINSLDILVHASVKPDPLPGVIMEAGLCKIPVVAANDGGVPEEVMDGRTGFLFNSGDINDLCAKLDNLIIMDTEKRKRIGEQGEIHIKNTFNPQRIILQFETLYGNLHG